MAQPPIQRLAEELMQARGVAHYRLRRALMMYIRQISIEEFEAQIDRVTNPKIFDYLWSVGLTWEQQRIVTLKAEKMGL